MDEHEIRRELRNFICGQLMRRPDFALDADEPLITGGLIDSFSLAQIGVFVEDRFDVYIPDSEITVDGMNTLNHMVSMIMAFKKKSS